MFSKFFAKVTVLAGLMAAFSFSTVSQAAVQQLPLKGAKISVAVHPYPPFVQVIDSLETLSGIDVDIIRELQRRTGFEYDDDRIHLTNLSILLDLGQKGHFDIIAGGLTINGKRGNLFNQSVPLFRSNTVLVTNTTSNVKSVNDMGGKVLANTVGSALSSVFPKEVAQQIRVHQEHSVFLTFYAVYKGTADALLIDGPMADDVINSWGKGRLKIAQDIGGSDSYLGLMFKKNSPYSVAFNRALVEMRNDGTIERIVQKYLPNYKMPPELIDKGPSFSNEFNVPATEDRKDRVEPSDPTKELVDPLVAQS